MIHFAPGVDASTLTPRGLRQIMRVCNRIVMIEHRNDVVPQHFENVPETRSGGAWRYAKRDAKYQRMKARRYKHQKPNVKTGELRKAVLGSARVTATADRARLIARGSRSSQLTTERRAEIEAVSSTEEASKRERWQELFNSFKDQPQYQKRIRKRGADGRFTKG